LRERQEVNFCQFFDLTLFLNYKLQFVFIFDYMYHMKEINFTKVYISIIFENRQIGPNKRIYK